MTMWLPQRLTYIGIGRMARHDVTMTAIRASDLRHAMTMMATTETDLHSDR